MENLINLKDLLKYEILDLYSAEKQIIKALPEMISKTYNAQLKNALQQHLEVTKTHKERLEKVYKMLAENKGEAETIIEDKGFFSRLFGGVIEPKSEGTEGLIREGKKIMDENMSPEVRDAAIIAAAQKIEHYEISGYGTALAYARQLKLEFAATIFNETLNEEYEADDLLTELALTQLNIDAEKVVATEETSPDINKNEGKSLFADYARDIALHATGEDEYAEDTTTYSDNKNIF